MINYQIIPQEDGSYHVNFFSGYALFDPSGQLLDYEILFDSSCVQSLVRASQEVVIAVAAQRINTDFLSRCLSK